jgi:hypothetical protein
MIGKLKTYGLVAGAALLAALAFLVKILGARNAALKVEVAKAKVNEKKAREVIEGDIAINEQEDERLIEVREELKNGHSKELSDPNDWGDE